MSQRRQAGKRGTMQVNRTHNARGRFSMKMIRRFLARPWQDQAREIFGIIYGREPTAEEVHRLDEAASDLRQGDVRSAFRRVAGQFDHQILPTGFAVRFTEADVSYASVGDWQLAVDLHDPSTSEPIRAGRYEEHLLRFYRERIEPGMVVADIGANVGLFTIVAAGLVGPEGRVLSFEPNSENCRLILLSLERNNMGNVTLFPLALGATAGHALFMTYLGSNGGFLPDQVQSLRNPGCTVVPTARLDDLSLQRVDLIKIDVEGAEGLVLGGGERLIESSRPVITSEFSPEMLRRVSGRSGEAYLQFFTRRGYQPFVIERKSGRLVEIDDVTTFLAHYGEPTRIEDLALLPR